MSVLKSDKSYWGFEKFIFLAVLFLPFIGLAADKAVITSVSVNESVPEFTVTWNQLEPIEECFVELTGADQDSFYSPPEDIVPCDTVGAKTKTVTLNYVQGVIPLYTVIIDNITGDIISLYVLLREPPPSYSPPPKGLLGHRPEVSIDSPKLGDALGPTTTIRYGVIDIDDYDYPPFGLGDSPVEIFYSDDKENWISIVKNLPKSGEYQWKSFDLTDGNYWLKIKAVDQGSDNDEEIAGPFGLDRILPSFEIFADPPVSKGEKVKIFAVSSEELKLSPAVFAKQRNYTDIEVFMSPHKIDEEIFRKLSLRGGEADEAISRLSYEIATLASLARDDEQGVLRQSIQNISASSTIYIGEYEVRPGFDGTANIKISGQDKAGNIGSIIRRGGTFSVGIQPPPPPVVIEPLDREIFSTSTISVQGGQVREDTKVVLTVNENEVSQGPALTAQRSGLERGLGGRYETRPDTGGNFLFENIPLSETFNNGQNILKVFIEDKAGNTSEPVILTVKRNIEPELSIISPVGGAVVSGTTTISFSARDNNFDKLSFALETSNDNGQTWQNLAKDFSRTSFEWLTFLGPDGKYILRVTAFDGIAGISATSASFIVRNNAPGIYFTPLEVRSAKGGTAAASGDLLLTGFTDDKPIISNTGSFSLSGKASSSVKRITNVDYRLQEFDEWQTAKAVDGAFDGLNERFQISLQGLPEGSYELEVRARDNRRYYGYGNKQIIVDFGSPPSPTFETLNGKSVQDPVLTEKSQVPIFERELGIVSDSDDQGSEKAGVQILIGGKAEKNNEIVFQDSALLEAKRPGLGKFFGKSDANGNFSIPITLRQHGQNIFKIKAVDRAGNESPEKEFSIIYNNAPAIRAIEPRDNDGIGGKAVIKWEAQDKDLDPIIGYNVFWRSFRQVPILTDKRSGLEWIPLARNLKTPEFTWDVSQFAEGFYELKIEASDGVSTGEKILKIFIDNTAPNLTITPFAQTLFNTKDFRLNFTGFASDNFSGIQAVEYRINGTGLLRRPAPRNDDFSVIASEAKQSFAAEWYQSVITSGFRENRAAFRVSHPFRLEDGEYEVQVRAVDVAGNISETKTQKIIIDTEPPRIGPTQVLYKNFEILPSGIRLLRRLAPRNDDSGVIASEAKQSFSAETYEILEGAEIQLRQSLEKDAVSAELLLGSTTQALLQNNKNGLWEATLSRPVLERKKIGSWNDLGITAFDEAGNKIEKEIGALNILKKGRVLTQVPIFEIGTQRSGLETKITVKIHDPDQKQFILWNAAEYGFENPIYSSNGPQTQYSVIASEQSERGDLIYQPLFEIASSSLGKLGTPRNDDLGRSEPEGTYSLFLPPGAYKMEIKKPRYQTITTKEFAVENPKFINFDFALKPRTGIKGFFENLFEKFFIN